MIAPCSRFDGMNLSFGVKRDGADDLVVMPTDKLIINLTRFKIDATNIDVLRYSQFCGNYGFVAPRLCFCVDYSAGGSHADSTRGATGILNSWNVVSLAHGSLFWIQLGVYVATGHLRRKFNFQRRLVVNSSLPDGCPTTFSKTR